jgi:hypothetical protein
MGKQIETKLTRQEILEHCRRASKIVATWPEWERNMIENSLRPEWAKPRDVVWHHAKKPVSD